MVTVSSQVLSGKEERGERDEGKEIKGQAGERRRETIRVLILTSINPTAPPTIGKLPDMLG